MTKYNLLAPSNLLWGQFKCRLTSYLNMGLPRSSINHLVSQPSGNCKWRLRLYFSLFLVPGLPLRATTSFTFCSKLTILQKTALWLCAYVCRILISSYLHLITMNAEVPRCRKSDLLISYIWNETVLAVVLTLYATKHSWDEQRGSQSNILWTKLSIKRLQLSTSGVNVFHPLGNTFFLL